MEISRFCCGISLSSAVKYLAIHGVVMSVLGMVGGAILLPLPFLIRIKQSVINNGIVGTAAFLLTVNFWWFFFSYLLYKTNKNDELEDLKNLIKICCYAIGFGEIFIMVVGFFLYFPLILQDRGVILFEAIWLIPQSLFIHGIRTRNPAMIEIWIKFQFVLFPVSSFLGLVCCILFGTLWWTIPQLLIVFAAFLYKIVLVIVHYNIMLTDINEVSTDLPPPYSSIDLYPTMI